VVNRPSWRSSHKGLKNYLLSTRKEFPHITNLDPAVGFTPFHPDFDIRSLFNHKQIMKDYKLGPNGAILTCLNLFASQMVKLQTEVDKRKAEGTQVFIYDTPGQIESFNWSASGQIITQTLAVEAPTVS